MTRKLLLLVITAAVGCAAPGKPKGPGVSPTRTARKPSRGPGPAPAREVLVGEMCPKAADGRPAVLPLMVRRLVWTADAEEAGRPLQTRTARQFSVFAWDGRRAGLFSVAGAADVGLAAPAAIGAYAGSGPCDRPNRGGKRETDPECVAAQADCGLALAVLEASAGIGAAPYDEDPEPDAFRTGGGCVAGDQLRVDIDGDGAVEAYPVAAFVAALYAPAEEVTSVSVGDGACEARFSARGLVPAGDPRDWLGLDLLGVVDVDADGRHEVVLAYRYAGRSTWAVYTAPDTVARLELAAESVPWQR